jgi:hypothetical protein
VEMSVTKEQKMSEVTEKLPRAVWKWHVLERRMWQVNVTYVTVSF